jgi:hypothetical protein
MVMIEQLQFLAVCGRPWAEERAHWALQLTEQLQQGQISESEYQELMADLVRSDRLEAEADDLDLKNMLVSTVMVVGKLA